MAAERTAHSVRELLLPESGVRRAVGAETVPACGRKGRLGQASECAVERIRRRHRFVLGDLSDAAVKRHRDRRSILEADEWCEQQAEVRGLDDVISIAMTTNVVGRGQPCGDPPPIHRRRRQVRQFVGMTIDVLERNERHGHALVVVVGELENGVATRTDTSAPAAAHAFASRAYDT